MTADRDLYQRMATLAQITPTCRCNGYPDNWLPR